MKIFDSRPSNLSRPLRKPASTLAPRTEAERLKPPLLASRWDFSWLPSAAGGRLALINWTNEAERLLASRLKESADVDTRPLQVAYN